MKSTWTEIKENNMPQEFKKVGMWCSKIKRRKLTMNNQEIIPKPIQKLFELKEDTPIWVKDDNDEVHFGWYYADEMSIWANDRLYLKSGSGATIKGCFESFLIAEIPKF